MSLCTTYRSSRPPEKVNTFRPKAGISKLLFRYQIKRTIESNRVSTGSKIIQETVFEKISEQQTDHLIP